MRKILLLAVLLLSASSIYAGGYRVATQGQRALAMGHAGVALVNSAETAFFNPSGIVMLEDRLNVSVGVSAVMSNVKWQNETTGEYSETDSPAGTPFYAYITYKINEWLSAGLSVYTPYGSEVRWEKDWSGSHLVNNIDLAAIYIQPLLSIRLSEHVSIGGGPIFATGNVEFNRNINQTLTDIDGNRSNVNIKDSGVTNWGWSASMTVAPTDNFRIAMNYRSEIILEAENGEATFSNIPNSGLVPAENGVKNFNASLPMPAELSIGAAWQATEKWLFALDYNRTYWEAYDNLDIDFVDPSVADSKNPRNYKNSSSYRFGMEYKASSAIDLRAGYYYDQTPVREGYFAPETPRNDSQGFTAGLSYKINENLAIDASFLYVRFKEVNASYDHYMVDGKEVPFVGTYKSNAFIPGIGVSYKL
ncbi:transporter [Psychroflexus sp. S27]|uniref:OmpP1/FadL family transporter n=1 Tax=Psychroflexus sp. S27 TaxID=1982757 RepID=UPI000C2B0273|nr:outer membrane protein transport protein [Psychroflexus sp. S27]PJX21771.1 transporter [Psychroflexus sp. S27]